MSGLNKKGFIISRQKNTWHNRGPDVSRQHASLCSLSDSHLVVPLPPVEVVLVILCVTVISEAWLCWLWDGETRESLPTLQCLLRYLEKVTIFYWKWPPVTYSLVSLSVRVSHSADSQRRGCRQNRVTLLQARKGRIDASNENAYGCGFPCWWERQGIQSITEDLSVQEVIHSCSLAFAETASLWTENQAVYFPPAKASL